jgi:hypothetical protein
MRTLPDLPGDVFLKGGFVDGAVSEGRNQRDERPLEHDFLPVLHRGRIGR